jgi:hypothetical protein
MPCPDYEALYNDFEAAVKATYRIEDADVARRRSMSSATWINLLHDARRNEEASEFKLKSHIQGCQTCRSENRKPFDGPQLGVCRNEKFSYAESITCAPG